MKGTFKVIFHVKWNKVGGATSQRKRTTLVLFPYLPFLAHTGHGVKIAFLVGPVELICFNIALRVIISTLPISREEFECINGRFWIVHSTQPYDFTAQYINIVCKGVSSK